MDTRIINAAFNRVKELESLFGDTIPASEIRKGLKVDGESILLENQVKGIFKDVWGQVVRRYRQLI